MKLRHPSQELLSDTTVIWRYISLDKLRRLLADEAIYFCRADLFDDPLEGILPGGTVKDIKNELPSDIAKILVGSHNANRSHMFVSCWHVNANESAAMWELYASKEKGIAIETTIGDLNSAITANENYLFAKVEYVEHAHYSNGDGDIYKSVFIKSKPFSHEQEVRLVHYSGGLPTGLFSFPIPTDKREGINFTIDVQALLRKIRLAPKSDFAFEETVRKLLNEHSVAADISRSKIYDVVNQFGPYN